MPRVPVESFSEDGLVEAGGALEAGGHLIDWRLRLLVRHFQEKEKRQLLDVIAVGEIVIPQDVAVVPQF